MQYDNGFLAKFDYWTDPTTYSQADPQDADRALNEMLSLFKAEKDYSRMAKVKQVIQKLGLKEHDPYDEQAEKADVGTDFRGNAEQDRFKTAPVERVKGPEAPTEPVGDSVLSRGSGDIGSRFRMEDDKTPVKRPADPVIGESEPEEQPKPEPSKWEAPVPAKEEFAAKPAPVVTPVDPLAKFGQKGPMEFEGASITPTEEAPVARAPEVEDAIKQASEFQFPEDNQDKAAIDGRWPGNSSEIVDNETKAWEGTPEDLGWTDRPDYNPENDLSLPTYAPEDKYKPLKAPQLKTLDDAVGVQASANPRMFDTDTERKVMSTDTVDGQPQSPSRDWDSAAMSNPKDLFTIPGPISAKESDIGEQVDDPLAKYASAPSKEEIPPPVKGAAPIAPEEPLAKFNPGWMDRYTEDQNPQLPWPKGSASLEPSGETMPSDQPARADVDGGYSTGYMPTNRTMSESKKFPGIRPEDETEFGDSLTAEDTARSTRREELKKANLKRVTEAKGFMDSFKKSGDEAFSTYTRGMNDVQRKVFIDTIVKAAGKIVAGAMGQYTGLGISQHYKPTAYDPTLDTKVNQDTYSASKAKAKETYDQQMNESGTQQKELMDTENMNVEDAQSNVKRSMDKANMFATPSNKGINTEGKSDESLAREDRLTAGKNEFEATRDRLRAETEKGLAAARPRQVGPSTTINTGATNTKTQSDPTEAMKEVKKDIGPLRGTGEFSSARLAVQRYPIPENAVVDKINSVLKTESDIALGAGRNIGNLVGFIREKIKRYPPGNINTAKDYSNYLDNLFTVTKEEMEEDWVSKGSESRNESESTKKPAAPSGGLDPYVTPNATTNPAVVPTAAATAAPVKQPETKQTAKPDTKPVVKKTPANQPKPKGPKGVGTQMRDEKSGKLFLLYPNGEKIELVKQPDGTYRKAK